MVTKSGPLLKGKNKDCRCVKTKPKEKYTPHTL